MHDQGLRASRLPAGVRYLPGDRTGLATFETTMRGKRSDVAIALICYAAEDAATDRCAIRNVQQLIHT